jgi:hypothetical protein
MSTTKNRRRCHRSKLRYPSDLADDGKRTVVMREVFNGHIYILSTGCQ